MAATAAVAFNFKDKDGNIIVGQTSPLTADGSLQVEPVGNGALGTAQVSVTTTATPILGARAGRNAVTVVNHGTTDVFLGGSGVTASTGLLLAGTKGASVTLPLAGPLYGVTGSGSQTVSAAETY